MKKILIIVAVLAVAGVLALNILSQRAPRMLQNALERAFGEEVLIQSIDYHFPGTFELRGFVIKGKAPFAGEASFEAETITFEVSWASLSAKKLILDKVEVEGGAVALRKT